MTNTEAPENLLCTKSHEYMIQEGNLIKIGITDHAVGQLGDIVFVEFPEVGTSFSKGEVFGTIESVKAASELYMPISGEIAEINEVLYDTPEVVNEDCYGQGWFIKIKSTDPSELEKTMTYEEYKDYIEQEE